MFRHIWSTFLAFYLFKYPYFNGTHIEYQQVFWNQLEEFNTSYYKLYDHNFKFYQNELYLANKYKKPLSTERK